MIVLHNDPQSLTELVANHSQTNKLLRLSLVCAAYGEPYYPYIKWSSPTEGVEDYSTVAINDSSVVVINDYLMSTAITVSVLQLCNVQPQNLTIYVCSADNGVERNATTSSGVFGNSSVVFNFDNDGVKVTLATGEVK